MHGDLCSRKDLVSDWLPCVSIMGAVVCACVVTFVSENVGLRLANLDVNQVIICIVKKD